MCAYSLRSCHSNLLANAPSERSQEPESSTKSQCSCRIGLLELVILAIFLLGLHSQITESQRVQLRVVPRSGSVVLHEVENLEVLKCWTPRRVVDIVHYAASNRRLERLLATTYRGHLEHAQISGGGRRLTTCAQGTHHKNHRNQTFQFNKNAKHTVGVDRLPLYRSPPVHLRYHMQTLGAVCLEIY
ncbi:hypothetical protein F4604DRAFT_195992 [Suillus subluteus]|nr:hypothetical protein F4604DRAFT_195992 [Suillus subluteus]